MKKPLKVFKFLNTRLNHVEHGHKKFDENSLFKKYDAVEVETKTQLLEIQKTVR